MEPCYISCVLMYSSEVLSAPSLSFSVTVWGSVRVCERSINHDELSAVCSANTVSVIKSQRFCCSVHKCSSRFSWRESFQERLVRADPELVEFELKTGPGQIFPKASLEFKCIKA